MRDRFLLSLFVVSGAIYLLWTVWVGFDLSLALSLIAFYVASYELRRDSTPMVRVWQCDASFHTSIHENHEQPFVQFKIVLKNQGVKLVDPTMTLEFRDPGGHGWFTLPIPHAEGGHGKHEHLERGMIAAFGWKSYKMTPV